MNQVESNRIKIPMSLFLCLWDVFWVIGYWSYKSWGLVI